jgi:hypothetical protein
MSVLNSAMAAKYNGAALFAGGARLSRNALTSNGSSLD